MGFSDGVGHQPQRWGLQPTFFENFLPKNCIKLKEIRLGREGDCAPPFGYANGFEFVMKYQNKKAFQQDAYRLRSNKNEQ